MHSMFFHLTYLLTKHECVIIPGFGGFVVSPLHAKKAEESAVFCPPSQSLGFNPELKHNDGILVNSIAKEKNIPYKEANILVRQFVDEIQAQLHTGKTVQINRVGKLAYSSESKIIFTPDNQLICNVSNYGLSNFYLPLLTEIETSLERPILVKKENKNVIWIPLNRRIVTMTGSVAAAVLALFLVSTPVNNHTTPDTMQYAGLLSMTTKLSEAKLPEVGNTTITDSLLLVDSVTAPKTDYAPPIPSRKYYIVVASLPDKISAEKMLAEIQSTGFKEANIVSNDDKHRIYVRQLGDKTEAEAYLEQFRTQYPQHSNAWLLSERVKS